MPKVVAILLSFFILGQGLFTYAAELEKMDKLLEHAQFHKEEYGDGFASFMSKHYGKDKEKHQKEHKDDHGHDQLPFQHCGQILIQSAFVFAKTAEAIESPFISETQQNNFFYQQLYSSQLINVLLQPPRLA